MTAKDCIQEGQYEGKTAAQWRKYAADCLERAYQSFQRSDTDGALSQWAQTVTAEKYETNARLAENNGRMWFVALFDLEGNHIEAREVNTRYGWAWYIDRGHWFNPSKAKSGERRYNADTKKGYRLGMIECNAYVQGVGDRVSMRYIAVPAHDPGEITVIDNAMVFRLTMQYEDEE